MNQQVYVNSLCRDLRYDYIIYIYIYIDAFSNDNNSGLGHQKNLHFFVISAVLAEKNSSVSCRINLKKRSKIFCVQWIITSCQLIVRYVLQLTSNFHEDSSKGVFCLAPRR